MNAPAILPEDEYTNARRAYIKFQRHMDWLEDAVSRLELSQHCRLELKMLSVQAKNFYKIAREEIFSKASVEQVTSNERR